MASDIMRVGSWYSATIRQSLEFLELKHLGKCFKISRTVPSDLHRNLQSPEFCNTGNIDWTRTQWLDTLAALVGTCIWFLATTWSPTTVCNSSLRDVNAFFWPMRHQHRHETYIYLQAKHIHKTQSSLRKIYPISIGSMPRISWLITETVGDSPSFAQVLGPNRHFTILLG